MKRVNINGEGLPKGIVPPQKFENLISKNSDIGLYFHIPFCKAKCHYCDFNSFANRESEIQDYFAALAKEIKLYREKLKDYKISTIFIGGGTPSIADAHNIYDLISLCRNKFNFGTNPEISIEANPGTLSFDKLVNYRAAGINRLSMGLQAWQEHLIKQLGRIHSREDFIENYKLARKAGFNNINIDLIFGIPGQTPEDWDTTLKNITVLNPEHISAYSLKIEEGTVFGDKLEQGELVAVDDEIDREMYWKTVEKLLNRGYEHYEISNFSLPGYECKHNLIYWKTMPYVGIGSGAHSFFENRRFNDVYDIDDYINTISKGNIPSENINSIELEDRMSEFIILGLRLIDGIESSEFKTKFDVDIMDTFGDKMSMLEGKNLIKIENARIRLTRKGLDLANQVFVEFI